MPDALIKNNTALPEIQESTESSDADSFSALPKNSQMRTVFSAGTFIIVLLAGLKITSDIAIPIVLAFVLKLVLQPVLRFLEKLRLPRLLAVLIILAALFSVLVGLCSALSGPAIAWAAKLPGGLPQLQQKLGFLSQPIETVQKFMLHAETIAQGSGPKVVAVELEGNRLSDHVVSGVRELGSILFTTVMVLFFLLASGDTFLRRLVEVLPRFKDKRQAVDISQHIEKDISGYLLTITVMNMAVGLATGLVMFACHIDDPVLWAVLAFLLNYVPIIGPLIGTGIFILAGLLSAPNFEVAIVPGALYLLIHILESVMITPLLVARRFTLNPVLVILSLLFWYWMWGFPGAILAMPMLAITKIMCDRIQGLHAFGHFLEG